ncbi:MAG: type II toxin-antitoxin system VapB family antitoxin [Acetivibrionales bacterium]|jgi:Arc/MetJ family transcription regulator
MRTTLNISDDIIAETQALYDAKNRSNAVEQALKDAIRFKKLQKLFALKGKVDFDEEYLEAQKRAEINGEAKKESGAKEQRRAEINETEAAF